MMTTPIELISGPVRASDVNNLIVHVNEFVPQSIADAINSGISLDSIPTPENNPPTGKIVLYNDSDTGLTWLDSDGNIMPVPQGTIYPPTFGSGPGNVSPFLPIGASLTEYGNASFFHTSFTLTAVSVPLTDDPDLGAFGNIPLYYTGNGIIELMCTAYFNIHPDAAGVSSTWSGDIILGNNSLSTGEGWDSAEDCYDPVAVGPAVSGVITPKYISKAMILGNNKQDAPFYTNDFSDTFAPDTQLCFKIKVDDGDQTVSITPTNMIVSGRIDIYWRKLFNY